MDVKTLISPAADWSGQRWLDRVDAAASLLFLHGYITQTQRAKVTQKLERQLARAIERGEIVQTANPQEPTP